MSTILLSFPSGSLSSDTERANTANATASCQLVITDLPRHSDKSERFLLINHCVAVLLQLSQPNHRVDVDLYSRQKVRVAPMVALCRIAAQLELYTLSHET